MKWLVVLLAACSGLHDPWPAFPGAGSGSGSGSSGPPPVPDDPRLGTLLHTGGGLPSGLMNDAVFAGDHLYVAVGELHTGDVPAMFVYEDGALLPAPPSTSYQVKLGISTGSGAVVGGENGTAAWDGAAWSVVPPPPVTGFYNPRTLSHGPDRIVVGPDLHGGMWFFDGTSWSQLALDVPATGFGPWDDAGLRLLYARGGNLCTALYALPAVTPGTETCTPDARDVQYDAIGGTTSAFTVISTDNRFLHFDGAWTLDDFAPGGGGLDEFPGITGVLSIGGSMAETPGFDEVVAGALGQVLVPSLPRALSCTCDRTTDFSCPCAPGAIWTQVVIAPDHTQVALVTWRSIDSVDKIYVRVEPLPLTTVPFTEPYP